MAERTIVVEVAVVEEVLMFGFEEGAAAMKSVPVPGAVDGTAVVAVVVVVEVVIPGVVGDFAVFQVASLDAPVVDDGLVVHLSVTVNLK